MYKEYNDYIVSKEWYQLKIDILEKRGSCCERCNKSKPYNILQLHHLTYERLFNEEPQDLILICPKCHRKEHDLHKKQPPKKAPKKKKKPRYKLSKRDKALQARYDKRKE